MMVAKSLPLLLFVVILTSGCGSASTPPSQLSALPSREFAQPTAFPATTAASEPEAGLTLVPTVPLPATKNAQPTQRVAMETPPSPPAIIVTSAIYPSSWMTYINHEYGFQIDYPDGFALGQEFISLGISDVVVSFRFPDLPQYSSFEFKKDVVVAYVEISVAAHDDLDPLLVEYLAGSKTVESGSTVFQNYVAGITLWVAGTATTIITSFLAAIFYTSSRSPFMEKVQGQGQTMVRARCPKTTPHLRPRKRFIVSCI